MFDAEKNALQQYVECDIEFLDRRGFDRSESTTETSVVVDAIESTPTLHHFIDGGANFLFSCDIDTLKEGCIAQFLRQRFAALGLRVGDQNARTFFGKESNARGANSARASS